MSASPCTFAISIVKLIFVVAITLFLSGCFSDFRFGLGGAADISDVVPAVQPVLGGVFSPASAETDSKGETFRISQNDDGTYFITDEMGAKEKQTTVLTFFGPVAGLYVAQIASGERKDKLYFYLIARIDPVGSIHFSIEDIDDLMGELLFERMGLPVENASSVAQLTDNAALNWVMLQELVIRYRHRMRFGLFITRLGD